MKKSSIIFLQVVIVLIGMGALAFLLIEPHYEGRNIHASLFEIYFKDPFLLYLYTASIAFFTALSHAFRLLRFIGQNNVFSKKSVRACSVIKKCAITLVAFILGAEGFFYFIQRNAGEDTAGGVMIGLVLLFGSVIVATTAAICERILQSAVDIKSENDLTV